MPAFPPSREALRRGFAAKITDIVTPAPSAVGRINGGGHVATIEGTCVVNRAPCTFAATVIDNGEPGKEDAFMITVGSSPSARGVLRGGNVRVQVP